MRYKRFSRIQDEGNGIEIHATGGEFHVVDQDYDCVLGAYKTQQAAQRRATLASYRKAANLPA